ncbi:AraC family transcriptional regulator [Paenibacillus sabinae]|uniref:DNA-binding domain-containing protein n=1 Tax=Paenibacillus sabinae T27 TaxID=1268072 RepID=X4ZEG7_9BACL|nr:AraC family transcriptional regulator [Paenibacillus sabinae]AHV97936.1 DNA-binding domain-containing protein [Paenibacillus sabinae T27]
MTREIRAVRYDADLKLEAYRFEGIMQKFPNHFHDYYVIGFIEQGQRRLICNNTEYIVNSGDVVIFNPHDPHACEQIDGRTLDYRSINIQPEVMRAFALEVTGTDALPRFAKHVLYRSELAPLLRELHLMILERQSGFPKEESFLLLLEQLLREYSNASEQPPSPEWTSEIQTVCEYIESNYTQSITLDHLSELTGISKYHLLRSFTRAKGITPYSYLGTIRINHAKKLLEQGLPPIEVAYRTGFSDQSHFTNFFKKLIGLTPKQYMRIFVQEAEPKPSKEIRV